MKNIAIAVISAATITCFLGTSFMLIKSYPNYDPNFFTATFIALGVFWVIGFIFAAMLMVVLGPLYQATSLNVSLALFLAFGFGVPFGLGYFASSIGAHGNPSSLEANWYGVMGLILVYSFIGAISAFAGWFVLRRGSSSVRT
jgi:hypothetical protein